MTNEEAKSFLIDISHNLGNMGVEYLTEEDGEKMREAVEALEQQPKIGHWISHREHCEKLGVKPSGLGAYEWCSNCDCGIDVNEFHRNHYNFCPNCGADMRESEE